MWNGAVTSAKLTGDAKAALTGPKGEQGPKGDPGPAGQPMRGQAWIQRESDSFEPGIPVRGFTAVDHVATGVYCLTPTAAIDPEVDPPIVTVEYGSSSGESFTVMWDHGTGECDDGDYEIKTYDSTDASETDGASFVVMVP